MRLEDFRDKSINPYLQLAYVSKKGILMPPASAIFGMTSNGKIVHVSTMLANLILYYFPDINRIYDPTCGTENYQFSDYLKYDEKNKRWLYLDNIEYIASDIKETKWNCIDGKCLIVDVLNPPYSFSDEYFDIVVYDPPFLPYRRHDGRANDYDIARERALENVVRYYDEKIISEFARIVKHGAIIKCQDFYYPKETNDLILCLHDVLKPDIIRKYFKIIGVHIYRYFISVTYGGLLKRARLGQDCVKKGLRKEWFTSSYYVILYKK